MGSFWPTWCVSPTPALDAAIPSEPLLNLSPPASWLALSVQFLDDVVRLFYALHLMLVFPVIHFSLRASLDAVIFPRAAPLAEDKPRFFLITALLLTAILVLSLVVPNVQFAFQFVGAAGAATIAFTLPGLIALRYTLRHTTSQLLGERTQCPSPGPATLPG